MLQKSNLEGMSHKNKLHLERITSNLYTHFRCDLPQERELILLKIKGILNLLLLLLLVMLQK
jgi:hypothetical protein